MYYGYVTVLENVRPHPNADRLQLGDCFGNTVCIDLTYESGKIGVYFPTDGQLSIEFSEQNNLLRKKDEQGNNIGGYLDPDKRNIKAIRLRGEKSDGLFLPLSCLDYCFADGASHNLRVGDRISVVNGHDICQKYIPMVKTPAERTYGNKAKKRKVNTAPTFFEHEDTAQLAYNLADFRSGDLVEISLKMHGTSQRTGYLPVLKGYSDSLGCQVGNAMRRLLYCLQGKKNEFEYSHDGDPIYEYDYITGTRRVVLDTFDGGFYGSNAFREQHAEKFRDKLWKGETVYYEVVGFTDTGAPIMGNANNKKLNDKEFIKMYGNETVFSYGCSPDGGTEGHYEDIVWVNPQSDIYIYRMTMTNEDGDVVEYTPDFMRYRCEQMGIKCVPVFWKDFIPEIENDEALPIDMQETPSSFIKRIAEEYYEGADPVGKTHIREGVVVRIVNRPKFTAYKHKNFEFKLLEGIIKDTAETPDMEEAQEVE